MIKENWMKNISYVSQKVFLLMIPLKKMLFKFDSGEIDKKKLELAIDISELKEKINSLKNGLDESVGIDEIIFQAVKDKELRLQAI